MRVLIDTNVLFNDRPILRAAIHAKAGVILTDDKDLLEANLKRPNACTPAQFLNM